MKIKVVSVGKPKKSGGFQDMYNFYISRIKNIVSFESIELKEKQTKEKETAEIIKKLSSSAYIVALRETGKKLDSIKFSNLIKNAFEKKGDIIFVVGGAYGYGNINEDISISIAPWTLPHQLAKIVLLEQIYRGLSINNGGKYHHE